MMRVKEAEKYLEWAQKKNPGPWAEHSKVVAEMARMIAKYCGLDGDYAYALGLIHDIGRYKGVTAMRHIYDGYQLLHNDGHDEEAQICITHSFPMKFFEEFSGKDDCDDNTRDDIKRILKEAVYTDYDALIQLCDSLALPTGICLMEKRLVDVTMRHGVNDLMIRKWDKLFHIFHYFEEKMGKSIYSCFPEVVENTFGFEL